MRKALLLSGACAAFGICNSLSAQVDLQASLNYGPTAALVNPALLLDRDVTIQLANVHSGSGFNFKPSDLGNVNGGRLAISQTKFSAGSPQQGRADAQFDASTLLVNVRGRHSQFGFVHAFRTHGSATASRDLAQAILFGNAELVGRDLDLLTEGVLSSWHEFGVHYGRQLSPKLTFGARAKFLLGANDLRIDPNSRLEANVSAEGYAISYDADLRVSASNYRINVDDLSFNGPQSFLEPGNGTGFALDLGLVYRPTQSLEIAFATQDLGMLAWKGELVTARGQGVYRGVEGNVFTPGYSFNLESALDELATTLNTESVSSSYSAALPLRFSGHARYRLDERISVALSGAAVNEANGLRGGLMMSGEYALQEGLHVGAGLGFQNSEVVFGGRVSARIGVVQIFASADHFSGIVSPFGSAMTQARVGIALGFGQLRTVAGNGGWYDNDKAVAGRTTPDNML